MAVLRVKYATNSHIIIILTRESETEPEQGKKILSENSSRRGSEIIGWNFILHWNTN